MVLGSKIWKWSARAAGKLTGWSGNSPDSNQVFLLHSALVLLGFLLVLVLVLVLVPLVVPLLDPLLVGFRLDYVLLVFHSAALEAEFQTLAEQLEFAAAHLIERFIRIS